MIEGNAFYEPGEESSVVSLNQEVDIFASHMKIYTTDTDKYEDIMDEPVEMEVFDEDAWASNLMLGTVVALGFAACAVVVVASGGAALGAVALAGAAVGTGLITAGVAYADRKNKKNRSREEFIGELAIGAGIGMLTALGIVYAGPSLLVAGEQAGVEASYCLGANVLTTSVIPDIVASGGGVLLATDGAYILNELNAMSTGENLAVETVFDGDEENYEDFVMVLEMLNQAFGDLTARGYQRTSAENNSSNITQKNKEKSSSETGLDIRNANDASGTSTLAQYGDDFGKMGTYVENPNIKVDWTQYAEHAAERMQQRGMTQEIVNNIVENGKVLSQNNGNKFAYITQEGVAIVSKEGKLITAWSSADFDSSMLEIISKLFGE